MLILSGALALALGGCNQAVATSPASTLATATPGLPSASSTTGTTGPSTTPAAGQTDTDWGRIWDSLPATFPIYPGATPAEEAATGPASATLALDGQDARTVAAWMLTELERAAFRTEALNGPLEDGSFVLESTGAGDCRIEVAVAPLGSLTTITVRYGADCPRP